MQTERQRIAKITKSDIPVFFGYDRKEELIRLKKNNEPFLYLDHAYFNRGYKEGNFRAIYNNIHQTDILDLPNDRTKLFKVILKEWREGERIVFIPAANNPLSFHNELNWNEQALDIIGKQTKREVFRKTQKTNGLGDSIKNCYCLVSHTSVAAVEAVCNGVRIATSEHNPAHKMGVKLTEINNLVTPDRTQWINTLTYSQFTLQELQSGSAWQIIKEINKL